MIPRNTALNDISAQMITRADGTDYTTNDVLAEVKTGNGAWGAANGVVSNSGGTATLSQLTAAEMDAEMVLVRFTATDAVSALVSLRTVPKQAYENWQQHFDNGASASSLQLDQLSLEATSQATLSAVQALNDFNPASDVVLSDVRWWQGQELTGTNMMEDYAGSPKWTTTALINAPSGAGSGNVTHILGTALVDLNAAGSLANNFSQFFGVDPVTSKDVNQVGSGTVSLPQTFLSSGPGPNPGNTGTHDLTHVWDGQEYGHTGNALSFTLEFSIGTGGNTPDEMNIVATVASNGSLNAAWEIYDWVTGGGQWEVMKLIPNAGVEESHTIRVSQLSQPAANYADGTGTVRYRFTTPAHSSGSFMIDAANCVSVTEQGSIPTPSEIAIAVEQLQAGIHGDRAWTGDYTPPMQIESVTSQTEFVLSSTVDGINAGDFLLVRDNAGARIGGAYITNWQHNTPSAGLATVTINEAIDFTVLDTMLAEVRLNPPVVVEAVSSFTEQQIRDAMKLAPTAGSPGAGSVDEHLDQIYTDTQAILVDTGSIEGKVDVIDANVDQLLIDVAALPVTSEVKAQLVEVMRTDTYPEPGQAGPPMNTSMGEKMDYLYKAWRNRKDQTDNLWSLYNAGATVVDQKASVTSDGTTTTKNEIVNGA